MVKSHRSKKHRGGEGEITDNNSVLSMDESTSATVTPVTTTPVTTTSVTTTPVTTTPAEEEKKGWFTNLFGGSRKKHVRFRMTQKHKRSRTKSKRSSAKRSSAKRSSAKKSSAKRKSRSTKRKSYKKHKGSSRK